ncbi:unnamed protein product [Sphagnum troendelagicum]
MCLPLLTDQLRNEITRLTAVKAFATIAESPPKIDLSSVLEQVVTELTTFLPNAYSNKISPSSYGSIVTELSSLISDADLHMTALALELCCPMMVDKQHHANVGMSMREHALPQTLIIVKSSLLQGQALQMLQGFFAALVQSANTSFKTLLESLLSTARSGVAHGGPVSKQAFYSIAQCVAVLCLADGDAGCSSSVAMLVTTLRTSNGTDATQLLSLLCLGEIGRRKDLSAHANIEVLVIGSFQSPFEEITAAASYALGNIAVIAHQSLNGEGKVDLRDADVQKILSLLFTHCESEEEGTD